MPNHLVAHVETVDILSAIRSELATIQHIQAEPEQGSSDKEDSEPDTSSTSMLEVCSDEESAEWEVQMDDAWKSPQDEEDTAANDLALLK